jgi:hypothetical protein
MLKTEIKSTFMSLRIFSKTVSDSEYISGLPYFPSGPNIKISTEPSFYLTGI